MIRHLAGGGPNRRDVLTECCLLAALPRTLTTDLDKVTCPDCKRSLVHRGICPECGEKTLTWSQSPHKLTEVPDGRLRLNEVTAVFYLGCDTCSETLIPEVSLDTVAAALTEMSWRP
jgi:ribosomal protein S27E